MAAPLPTPKRRPGRPRRYAGENVLALVDEISRETVPAPVFEVPAPSVVQALPASERDLWTVDDVADYFSCGRTTARELIHTIGAVRATPRLLRVRRADVEAFVARGGIG